MRRFLPLLLVAACILACGRSPKTQPAEPTETIRPAVFLPSVPPAGLSPEARADYQRVHYWDRFDFSDTLFLQRVDPVRMLEAFASYIALYVGPSDPAPVDTLMRRASVSRPMLDYFRRMAERVLHDPNSPLRSDELYVPVLRAVLASPWYDRWERMTPEHDLRLALQNRVGQQANDFRYVLPSGGEGTLYGLDAEYTLLLITNPECPLCGEVSAGLAASPRLKEMIERGDLKVLAVYPDEDETVWRTHLSEMPSTWINAWDKENILRNKELYDLRAIPSLYLLDRHKRVLVKDEVHVARIEEVIDHHS